MHNKALSVGRAKSARRLNPVPFRDVGTSAAISQFRGEQAQAGILNESLLILLSHCLTSDTIVEAMTADAR